jgi:predicted dienelactone hydrolase
MLLTLKTPLCLLCLCGAILTANAETLQLELPGPKHLVPIKVYLPENTVEPAPVVLFSHGLGGSREGSAYVGEHWSAAGYIVVAMQHPSSDESVWKDLPNGKRMGALKEAANVETFMDRISDVATVFDYLEGGLYESINPLYGRIDLSHIAMAGHSYGAVTSQAIMGQNFRHPSDTPFFDDRIDCVILMSPSASKRLSNEVAFGHITLPVLCMTGTEDGSPLDRATTPESRKQVFAALPKGQAYQIVFDGGTHSIFSDRSKDSHYHDAIMRITTVFLNAYLKEDLKALAHLRSESTTESLSIQGSWEWK